MKIYLQEMILFLFLSKCILILFAGQRIVEISTKYYKIFGGILIVRRHFETVEGNIFILIHFWTIDNSMIIIN